MNEPMYGFACLYKRLRRTIILTLCKCKIYNPIGQHRPNNGEKKKANQNFFPFDAIIKIASETKAAKQ